MPGVDKISDYFILKIMLESNVRRIKCKPYDNTKKL